MTLMLRPATPNDAMFIWRIRNDPDVRSHSIDTGQVPWPTHEAWYIRRLSDPGTRIFIAELHSSPFGFSRLEAHDVHWTISVALKGDSRGRGLGTALIHETTIWAHRHGIREVVALVRPENHASLHAFARCNYVYISSEQITGVEVHRLRHR